MSGSGPIGHEIASPSLSELSEREGGQKAPFLFPEIDFDFSKSNVG